MRDVDIYQAVLGITAPWKVTRVELGLEAGQRNVSTRVRQRLEEFYVAIAAT